jgi:glycosyltransferase involved in cell wall biosynthesis
VIEIVVSRDAPYARDLPFTLRLVDRSPTFETAAVNAILADFRPHVAIFDSSGRVDQYRAAHRLGAKVVFVSSRPSSRRKGFRLRRMRWFDQHWIAQPRFLGGNLRRRERAKSRLLGGPETVFLDALHEPVDEQAASARLRAAAASPGQYVLVCPGGGGVFGRQPAAVPEFYDAACAIAQRGGWPVIAVLGSRFSPSAAPPAGVHVAASLPNGELMGLLRDARVAVLNGGSLLVQAIAQRTPSVAAPIADDQPARISTCAKAGLTRATALSATELADAAIDLSNDETRLGEMRSRAASLDLQNGVDVAMRALARWLPAAAGPPSHPTLSPVAVSSHGDRGRLRILHVILSSGFAGSERAAAEACNAMRTAHEVAIVLRSDHHRPGAGSIRDHLAGDVEVIEIPRSLFTRAALDRALRRWQPDVVHTHLRRGTRLIAQLGPSAVHFASLHLSINGPHFLETDALHCISDWQLATVPADYKGRVFLIPNSLVPQPRLDAARVAQLREELGARPGEFLIGGAGRLAASKGFDVLIRAFERASLPNARLAIVGDGREAARLERLANGRVRLTGFRSDVKDCFQAFDLFVSASRREPFGRVIVEALDGGAPVVATDTQGAGDIGRRYPLELVPNGDVDALASALTRAHARPRARVNVDLSEFHVERVVARMLDAYREVLASREPRARSLR